MVTTPTGNHVVTVSRNRTTTPRVIRLRSTNSGTATLKQLVERSPAAHYRATTLLDRDEYHLLLVEAPDVRPEELRAAVRWRIKDLIGFHVDDAVIDVFEIPDQRHANRNRMMYTVAARASRVTDRAQALENAGLNVDVVDIPEMALRNIAMLLPEENDGLALVHLGEDSGIITLSRRGVLYLTRRLDVGTRALGDAGEAARTAACENVLLEIQRSLDYYESHFPHGPVNAVALTPMAAETKLADYLREQLEIKVFTPRLDELLAFDEPPDRLEGDALLAIGAALRQEARAL